MPDFETVVVRAPYEVELDGGSGPRRGWIDDAFRISIPSLSSSDVKLAVRAQIPRLGPQAPWLDFVDIGGKLFRPYVHPYAEGFWSADRCRSAPPQMSFRDGWGAGCAYTTMLGSPFRHSFVDAANARRPPAEKAAREARKEAGQRAMRLGKAGLVLVDGLLHQETRTPGWTIYSPNEKNVAIGVPDLDEGPGVTLIDPRLPGNEVGWALGKMGFQSRTGDIRVIDPSLLPATIERDALACFGVQLCQRIAGRAFMDFDRHFSAHVLATVNAIESAWASGAPLEPCYEAIDRMASWPAPMGRLETDEVDIVRLQIRLMQDAQFFRTVRHELPPPGPDFSPASDPETEVALGARKP